jgi:hypothetical protein
MTGGARSPVENTLFRYAYMYDMDDLLSIGECLTEDVEVEFSTGLKRGKAEVEAELERQRGKYRTQGVAPRHLISNIFIRHETSYEVEVTSSYAFFVKPLDEPPSFKGLGYYNDTLVDEGGIWKLKARRR